MTSTRAAAGPAGAARIKRVAGAMRELLAFPPFNAATTLGGT